MPAWPDAAAVQTGLARVWRRIALRAVLKGVTAGFVVAAVFMAIGWRFAWPIGALALAVAGPVALGGLGAWIESRRARPLTAQRLEARAPACRNVVITADQIILRRDQPIRDDIGARICRDAAAHLAAIDVATLFPLGQSIAALTAAAIVAGTLGVAARTPLHASVARAPSPHAATIGHVDLVLTPPAYTNRAAETIRDPKVVAVLAGTRIDLAVAAEAATVLVETADAKQNLAAAGNGSFTGRVDPAADGFVIVQPIAADGTAGTRTVIGLTVTPDRPPLVRIATPGRDLMLPSGDRRIDVAVEAADDLALDTLRLAYTKVTGSGESFEFTKGEVPLTIARANDREWRGTATWPLAPLSLRPGDMVVYRGVAADRRPGAAPVESDALIVEIAAPGSVAAEGFAMDDQRDRYALSQRMVILKTEKLVARRASMKPDDVADEATGIAAEQRSVRAEFIFMMGGELEGVGTDSTDLNEEAEAAGEADLLAGRARNRGRIDLLTATRKMSEAATSLTMADLGAALPAEKAALEALQRAFAKDRYLLRVFATRERPDPTRRMTGALKDVAHDTRPAEAPPEDPRLATLRRALAAMSGLTAHHTTFTRDDAALATVTSDAILRLDPASTALRDVAADLNAAAAFMTAGRTADVTPRIGRAATALAAVMAAALPAAPADVQDARAARLNGALVDARQKRGGR